MSLSPCFPLLKEEESEVGLFGAVSVVTQLGSAEVGSQTQVRLWSRALAPPFRPIHMELEGRAVEAPPPDAIHGLKATGWMPQCSLSTFSPGSTLSTSVRPDGVGSSGLS